MDTNLKFAGDVNVESVIVKSLASGNSIDIKNQVLGINVYEDLFSPFMSGSISVKDSLDIANALPFSGEEIVHLKIETPSINDKGKTIDADFYVYKMGDREYTNDRSVIYSLYFISVEAITDANKKLSKGYKGSIDNMIKELVKNPDGLDSSKQLFYEPSSDNIKFVANYWSPVKIIDFLSEKANNKSKSPSYIFYENRDGFNFVSLDTLYQQPIFQDFNYSNFTKIDGSYRDIAADYKRITHLSIPTVFNYLDDIQSGKFSSKRITYDFVTKQYKLEAFDYFQEYGRGRHLNQFPTASKNIIKKYNAWVTNDVSHYEIHTGFGSTTLDNSNAQRRRSLLLQSRSNCITITVPGRLDYTVGQKVNLTLYKAEPIRTSDSNDDILDKLNSGNYLISAINHNISKVNGEHECVMELIKDSVMFDISKGN